MRAYYYIIVYHYVHVGNLVLLFVTGACGSVRSDSWLLWESPAPPAANSRFYTSRANGTPHDQSPGPCVSTAPVIVSREVVLMSCGLRRARRRRAATTEPRRWRKIGGRNLGCGRTPLSAATATVARPNSKFRPVQAIIPGENYGLYWADSKDRPRRGRGMA